MSEKKVYIVTSGSYSDYGINAVFSTEEAADAYAERHNRADHFPEYRVEAYDLDATIPKPNAKIAFKVSYILKPDMPLSTKWYASGYADQAALPFEDVRSEEVRSIFSPGMNTQWETWVWADTEQEALKIGADRIMPVLAAEQIEGVVEPGSERGPFDADTPFLNLMTTKAHLPGTKVTWGMADIPPKAE